MLVHLRSLNQEKEEKQFYLLNTLWSWTKCWMARGYSLCSLSTLWIPAYKQTSEKKRLRLDAACWENKPSFQEMSFQSSFDSEDVQGCNVLGSLMLMDLVVASIWPREVHKAPLPCGYQNSHMSGVRYGKPVKNVSWKTWSMGKILYKTKHSPQSIFPIEFLL